MRADLDAWAAADRDPQGYDPVIARTRESLRAARRGRRGSDRHRIADLGAGRPDRGRGAERRRDRRASTATSRRSSSRSSNRRDLRVRSVPLAGAGRRDRTGDLARRVLPRAVRHRAGRGCRGRSRGRPPPRHPHPVRCHAGRRGAPGRREPLRLHGLPHLQVALLAARRRRSSPSRASAEQLLDAAAGRLVRRATTRGRTATGRPCTWLPTPGASTSRPPGRPGSAPSTRSRCSPVSTSPRSGSAPSGLGDALCDALGIPQQHQAIVAWPDPSGQHLRTLIDAGIRVSGRAGRLRASFHLWNDLSDVDAVVGALGSTAR